MKAGIKEKLDRIDELFPPERLEKSKKRWEAIWSPGQRVQEYPYTAAPITFNYYNAQHTPKERLEATLDEIIYRGILDDDFIPSLFPGCNQATIPTMFGAKAIRLGEETGCEKLIQDESDVERLPEPQLVPGTIAYDFLKMEEYFLEETQGRIPIHVCDMQGPADVCGQLWGYDDFFVCALTEEELFHQLMDKVTRAFTLFWNAQKNLLGDRFVPTHLFGWDYVPGQDRVSLSADSLVMVSGDFYDQFFKPSIERMGEELGDISIHSCGNFGQVVPHICRTNKVKAINASQMSPQMLLDAGMTEETVLINLGTVDTLEESMKTIRAHRLHVQLGLYGVAPDQVHPTDWTDEQKRKMMDQCKRIREIMNR